MKTKFLVFIAFILLFISAVSSAFAVTVSITNFPSVITDEAFTISASVSGASVGTNYLRIDIFKDQTSNYFGETFNGTDWYGGSTFSQYFPINIQSGVSWTGNLQGRVGNPSSTDYDGSGQYKIRLRRYTGGGGNTTSEANASAVSISIAFPTSTPMPTQAQNAPTPTKTPTPINTPTPTSKPTLKPTPSPKVTPVSEKNKASTSQAVLGVISTGKEEKKDEEKKKQTIILSDSTIVPKVFISLGGLFLILCAALIAAPSIKKMIKKEV